nr:uncharacterized protein LOC125988175 isoform X1 [Syngnathus scovelli]
MFCQLQSILAMPRERLLLIGSSGNKTVKPHLPSRTPQRMKRRKHSHQERPSDHGGQLPLLSDSTVTPWRALLLSDSSFSSIHVAPSPKPPPSTPHLGNHNEELTLSFSSSDEGCKELITQQKMWTQSVTPRPTRLPPMRPITNLSFSRSFTFSFFELPLHQSPRWRSERMKNLMQLLRQTHY